MPAARDIVSPLSDRPSANWSERSVMQIDTPSDGLASPADVSPGSNDNINSRVTSHYDPSTGQLKDGIVEDPGMHPMPDSDAMRERTHIARLQRESASPSNLVPPTSLAGAVHSRPSNMNNSDDANDTDDVIDVFHDGPMISHYGQSSMLEIPRDDSHMTSPEPPSEKEQMAEAAATAAAVKSAQRSRRRRRRRRFAIVAIVAILAIIAIVLGAVLGTRASSSGDKSGSSTSQSSPSSTPSGPDTSASSHLPQVPHVNSTHGVWNGTGLALLPTIQKSGDYYQSFLIYQSYTADLYLATVNFSDALLDTSVSAVSKPVQVINSPKLLGLKIAPGSNMATQEIPALAAPGGIAQHMLVYVHPNGTLGDVWAAGDDLDTWKSGNLTAANIETPLDNRAALLVQWDACFGKSVPLGNGGYDWGRGGLRLWVGGADGLIHQYSYDLASGEWGSQPVTLESSWAYGAVVNAQRGTNVSCINRHIVMTTNSNGSVSYYTGPASISSNDTLWPTGAPWSGAQPMSQNGVDLASNSSMVGGLPLAFDLDLDDQSLLYAVGNDGSLQAAPLAADALYAGQAAATTLSPTVYSNITVMPGSALVGAQYAAPIPNDAGMYRGVNLIVYQSNGSSVDWAVLADGSVSGNAIN